MKQSVVFQGGTCPACRHELEGDFLFQPHSPTSEMPHHCVPSLAMAPPAVPPPVVAPQPNEVFPPEAPPQHAVMPFGLQSQMQQMLDMMAGFSQVTHGKGGGGSASSVHESSVHESDSDGGESDDDIEIVKRHFSVPFHRALIQGPV